MSDQGKQVEEIADIYNIQNASVTRWFDCYEANGISGLKTLKGQERPPILRIDNEVESKKIELIVDKSSQNLNQAITKIEKQLGKKMCNRTLKRCLKKNGNGSVLERACLTNQQKKS